MTNPITTTSNSQMHDDIMVAGSIPAHKVPETYNNISLENRAYFDAKAEAIRMILSGIGDDIYFTVDACTTAQEMWVAIERLQQEYHNQAPKPHKPIAPSSRQITSSKSHATTKNKDKEVVKLVTPPSESAFEEDNDEEQA
ncbi:hypothetical protein Tco_0335926 [Tanacetum coccineum]